jgi:hypothetical protein
VGNTNVKCGECGGELGLAGIVHKCKTCGSHQSLYFHIRRRMDRITSMSKIYANSKGVLGAVSSAVQHIEALDKCFQEQFKNANY